MLVIVTLALGTIAPVASLPTPSMSPFNAAQAVTELTNRSAITADMFLLYIVFPPKNMFSAARQAPGPPSVWPAAPLSVPLYFRMVEVLGATRVRTLEAFSTGTIEADAWGTSQDCLETYVP